MLKYTVIIDKTLYHPELVEYCRIFYFLKNYKCDDFAVCVNEMVANFLKKQSYLASDFILVLGSQTFLDEVIKNISFNIRLVYVPLKTDKENYVKNLSSKINEKIKTPPQEIKVYSCNEKDKGISKLTGGFIPSNVKENWTDNLKKYSKKEPCLMRIYTEDKIIVGKYLGFVWQNDYLDNLYMGKSKLFLLKKELTLQKLQEMQKYLKKERNWRSLSMVECYENEKFLIETNLAENSLNKIELSPCQKLMLSK